MDNRRFHIGKIFFAMIGLIFVYAFLFIANGNAQTSKGTLKLAIIPHRSTLGNEQAYGMLIEALEKETGINFQWTGSKTYDEVIK
jgi:phosphonate transport system substrate-binding protein